MIFFSTFRKITVRWFVNQLIKNSGLNSVGPGLKKPADMDLDWYQKSQRGYRIFQVTSIVCLLEIIW